MRKTKIICTLGPASESEEMLDKLILAGVNIFRLNMSHAPHDWVREVTARIHKVAEQRQAAIGILLDTQGPAIRTGDLPTKLDLKVGDTFQFTVRGFKSEEVYSVDTNYDDLVKDVKVGDVVLVDNGVIHMVVVEKNAQVLKCQVLTPGTLGNRRHINLPGVKVNLPPLTEKDLEDLDVGLECGVDFVALSFVREANDISILRQVLASHGKNHVKIVAKIEDQLAVRHIDEIVHAADGIMVARGDLGIECPYEELPIIQRAIVKKCLSQSKPVIVATHMLESMIQNPVPTRAEITDVANAVFESADAIMLSGETTVGKYPVECVKVLDKVARRIERSGNLGMHSSIQIVSHEHATIASAINLADKIGADGICIFTISGNKAALCAALRPRHTPIFTFTPTKHLPFQLTLRYGVYAFPIVLQEDPERTIFDAQNILLMHNFIQDNSTLVILSDILSRGEKILTVQLRTVKKPALPK